MPSKRGIKNAEPICVAKDRKFANCIALSLAKEKRKLKMNSFLVNFEPLREK
jgi:hypothetical protein